MSSNDTDVKSKNVRYIAPLLFFVSAICFFYVIVGQNGFFDGGEWGWLMGGAPAILQNIAAGFAMILLGISVLFAVYLTVSLLKGKEEDVPRFAKPYFMLDICVTSFCLIFYMIAAIITGTEEGNAMPAVAAVIASALRAGVGVVLFLTYKGVIRSKFTAGIIAGAVAFADFVMFVLTLAIANFGNYFNYELFGYMAFSAAFAVYFLMQELRNRPEKAAAPQAETQAAAGGEAEQQAPLETPKSKVKKVKDAEEEKKQEIKNGTKQ